MFTLVDYQQNILPLSEIIGHTFKTWQTQNIGLDFDIYVVFILFIEFDNDLL